MKASFTTNEIDLFRKLSLTHPHNFVRCKALALLLISKNLTIPDVAQILNVCMNTIRSYLKNYLTIGIDAIIMISFRIPKSSLEPFKDKVCEYFKKTPPATIKQACSEIEQLTGIKLKQTQMRSYVKSIGVKCRKTYGIPAKADPIAQNNFLENKLQPRLEEARNGKRTVHFVDAAHFVLGPYLSRLWSFNRVPIKTPSGRQRFNVLGALDAITKEVLTITNTSYITSNQICELLNLIAEKAMDPTTKVLSPVTIVLDNASYQRCALVTEKAKSLGIELLFLPTYSPNLNLIERLWKFIRKQCLNSIYYSDFKSFRLSIDKFIKNMHTTHLRDLKSLMTLNFQTLPVEEFVAA